MIIVRSALEINSFIIGVYNTYGNTINNNSNFTIVLVGSVKILSEVNKLYGVLSHMQYIVADYGNYLFINRIKGREMDDRVWIEHELLKTGIKYDVVLAMQYCPIDLPEIANVPRLEVPSTITGSPTQYRNRNPIAVLPLLDEMFAPAQQ